MLLHGLDDNFARQLVRNSYQEHILEWTPRDAAERFTDKEALGHWVGGNRDVYVLTPGQRLAAMTWYEEKPFPMSISPTSLARAPHHTFGIRVYEGYLGKGLAYPLMTESLIDYVDLLDSRDELNAFRGLWLSVRQDNEPARRTYQRFGYNEIGFTQSEVGNRLIMVLSLEEIVRKMGALSSAG